jgi:hypothetical protein
MTPQALALLRSLQRDFPAMVNLRAGADHEVRSLEWMDNVTATGCVHASEGLSEWLATLQGGDTVRFDCLVLATGETACAHMSRYDNSMRFSLLTPPMASPICTNSGMESKITSCGFMESLLSRTPPAMMVEGFPALDKELRWRADVPCYLMGACAALSLGPAASNLVGAVAASRRISAELLPIIEGLSTVEVERGGSGAGCEKARAKAAAAAKEKGVMKNYSSRIGSRFSVWDSTSSSSSSSDDDGGVAVGGSSTSDDQSESETESQDCCGGGSDGPGGCGGCGGGGGCDGGGGGGDGGGGDGSSGGVNKDKDASKSKTKKKPKPKKKKKMKRKNAKVKGMKNQNT